MTLFIKNVGKQRFLTTVSVIVIALGGITARAYGGWLEKGADFLKSIGGSDGTGTLSNADISAGLKEALRIATQDVVSQLGRTNGFADDSAVHIPLPKQLDTVRTALATVGMSQSLDELDLKLNRAAELATPKAKALFLDTISQMTFTDVQNIYKGPGDAATRYFEKKMTPDLTKAMQPIISGSLSQVGAIQTYDRIMGQYESLPFVPDVKADLTSYVTTKALDGIFYYVAKEEAAIRQDPVRQTTDLLKRVFGSR